MGYDSTDEPVLHFLGRMQVNGLVHLKNTDDSIFIQIRTLQGASLQVFTDYKN